MGAAHGLQDVPGQRRARVELRHHDAGYRELWVEARAHKLVRVHEVSETFEREVLALGRDEHAGRRDEGVERQEAQRRRAVDQDDLDAWGDDGEALLEQSLAVRHPGELDLCSRQVDVGRDQGEAGHAGRLNHLLDRGLARQQVVNAQAGAGRVEAQAGRGVRLRIKIDQQRRMAHLGHGRAEVDRRGGFPHTALLVDDGDDRGSHRRQHVGSGVACGSYILGH